MVEHVTSERVSAFLVLFLLLVLLNLSLDTRTRFWVRAMTNLFFAIIGGIYIGAHYG